MVDQIGNTHEVSFGPPSDNTPPDVAQTKPVFGDVKSQFDAGASNIFGKEFWNEEATHTVQQGRPILPPTAADDKGSASVVPDDIKGNIWFSGNMLASLRIAMMEIEKVNRDTNLTFGLKVAELTNVVTKIAQSIAKLTQEIYQQNVKEAIGDIIGGCVGLATSGLSLGLAIHGGIAAAKGGPVTAAKDGGAVAEPANPPPKPGEPEPVPPKEEPPTPSRYEKFAQGLANANQAYAGVDAMGRNLSTIISNAFKINAETDKGIYERQKIQLEQGQKLIEQVVKTLQDEGQKFLEDNDRFRNFLDEVNRQAAQLFGWQR